MAETEDIDTQLLLRWDDAWRDPELWRALTGDTPSVPVEQAVHGVLRAIAGPATPQDALRTLLQAGAFSSAQALLAHPGFRCALGPGQSAALEALQDEHDRAQARVRAKDLVRRRFEQRAPAAAARAVAVARDLPEWPHRDPVDLSCRMLLDGTGYPGLRERWAPDPGDRDARALLEALGTVPRAQHDRDRTAILALGAALAAFLRDVSVTATADDPGGDTVVRGPDCADHVVFQIPGLWSSTIPVLGSQHVGSGLCVAVPMLGASVKTSPPIRHPYLHLDPDGLLRGAPPGALRVHPGDLFGLLRNPASRASRLLAYVGHRMDPSAAFPRSWLDRLPHHVDPDSSDLPTVERLAALLADLGVATAGGDELELLVFLTAGNPRSTWELLVQVLRGLGSDGGLRGQLSSDRVAATWAASFQNWLTEFAAAVAAPGTLAGDVLHALLEDLATSPPRAGERLPALAIADLGSYLGVTASGLGPAVGDLIRAGLVEPRGTAAIGLVDGGITWQLCATLEE